MGTYANFCAHKKEGDNWVEVPIPTELGWKPDLPYHFGKFDMMDDIDRSVGFNLDSSGVWVSRRTNFMAPPEFFLAEEHAPWVMRGLPADLSPELRKEFLDDCWGQSWVLVDEVLGYDFDKASVSWEGVDRPSVSWAIYLGPGFREWFVRLKAAGIERVTYSFC